MKHTAIILCLLLSITSCQKEEITFSAQADETFYVEHANASMRVQVRGNTLSDKIILTVHGGPGGSSYYLSYLQQMQTQIEPEYAVAYWDQPLAGASQGNAAKDSYAIEAIATGLKKVVQVLRNRYGADKQIILFSESWGGIITTAFLTQNGNQALVDGWINSDGPHDFHLQDREIIKMAIRIGEEQIMLGKNVDQWQEIVSYCRANNPADNYAVSQKLNDLLGDAEYLIDEVVQVDFNTLSIFYRQMQDNHAPFTALGLNLVANGIHEVEKDAYNQYFEEQVHKITVPVLLLWGKYDFIAPPAVADSLYKNIASQNKRKVILPRSGHNGFIQEPLIYWSAFKDFVDSL
jgi:pimeloyl-ACP methyl ester carboxylesterase